MEINNTTIELSSGERAALTKGLLIVTREQMAVCYVVASNQEVEVNFGGGIDSTLLFVECGMNQETYRRTVAKFILILNGQGEDEEFTAGENMRPKQWLHYNEFSNLKPSEVFEIAKTAFTYENKVLGQEIYKNLLKSKEVSKQLQAKIQYNSTQLYRQLVKQLPQKNAIQATVKKIAVELDIEESQVKNNWDLKLL